MAWLAARESGNMQEQVRLLRELSDRPEEQDALVDFIAAYTATDSNDGVAEEAEIVLLPLTQRALRTAFTRVFAVQEQAQPVLTFTSLSELRKSLHLKKLEVAQGLRLSIDVWNKFEDGAIELVSLSSHQLSRLANFFQISTEQFGLLLNNSQPTFTQNRRQTAEAAQKKQGAQKQSMANAIARSTMSREDKQFWLEQ